MNSSAAEILKSRVDAVDYAAALARASPRVPRRRKTPLYVIQANVLSLVTGWENPEYRNVLAAAGLSVPDGMPLVWLLRLKGYHDVERVYGPDLMLLLCERAAKEGWRCYFYGGKPGVPEQLKENLVARFPGLNVVGTYSPPFRELSAEEDAQVCAMINATKPDILWVGLGSPKQDIWMYEHREKLEVSVIHGVGAAFDFLTGKVRQAPRWMMRAGLEWLFRLVQEPRRLWKRYTIVNLKFVAYLLADVFRRRPKE